jgi:hypothetical protein
MVCCICLFSVWSFTSCVIFVPVWEFSFLLLQTATVSVLRDATQKGGLYMFDERKQWPRGMGTGSVERCRCNRWLGNCWTSRHECVYSCVCTVYTKLIFGFSVRDWPVISPDNTYKNIGTSGHKISLQCIYFGVFIFISNIDSSVLSILLCHYFPHSSRHNRGV